MKKTTLGQFGTTEKFYCQFCDKVSEIDFERDGIIRLKCGHNTIR